MGLKVILGAEVPIPGVDGVGDGIRWDAEYTNKMGLKIKLSRWVKIIFSVISKYIYTRPGLY